MFIGHGSYAVEHDQSIIVFVAQGAWNLEASKSAIELISLYVDAMSATNFAIIANTRQVEGITPDSFKVWLSAVRKWLHQGHTTLARVDEPRSAYYKIFLSKFDEFARAHQQFQLLDSMDEAFSWLHQLGFKGFENGLPALKFFDGLDINKGRATSFSNQRR
ncbi:hypothetical protein P2G88_04135 [Aliiglaciecola sp. CAU 1673]|uniref:hypothetical protein n=1 Tax=Aliiglaciecola sp. CAU 1673 TaxID=3032595 RepID=UPI0023D9ED4C|nr:hypothetical protein [Aliiglaciecola sp. CAU 1673]MDF2177434.1 hypothetical protein [Aliiglaciecola sp. CAU 1673]